MKARAVIFSDIKGWHEKQLSTAFHKFEVEATVVSLSKCRYVHENPFGGLIIPGFEVELPDIAFVRGISSGTFEQVTFRLDILHSLQELSVPVVNRARVIERTVDKVMTSHMLLKNGISTVPAWSFESLNEVENFLVANLDTQEKFVMKPMFGSRGRGLVLLDSVADLPDSKATAGVCYLQKFISASGELWRDWRVMVSGGQAVCAMERRSENWITNRAQGGQCHSADLDPQALELAERAVTAVDAAYGGVDIIQTQQGEWQVLEINGVPAWRGLQSVTQFNIAERLVSDCLEFL